MKKIMAVLTTAILIFNMVFAMGITVNAQSCEFLNPITGTAQGAGYDENSGHYGIDLYPYNYGDPVYAVASGTISYSCERNHTKAVQSGDDCCTVKILLDEPLTYNGYTYISAFYTHMSRLVYDVYCGYNSGCISDYNNGLRNGALKSDSIHVNAGDLIGYAGKGNGATHLHFSFETGADSNYHMMANSEIFKVMGWSHNCSLRAGEPTCRSSGNNNLETTPAVLSSSFDPLWPCDAYYITCLYYYKDGSKHSATYYDKAIDIAKSGDIDIRAIESGKVTFSGWSSGGLGYKVMIEHSNGSVSIYGHLKSRPVVSVGSSVTRGQVIGKMGGTGGRNQPEGHIEYGQHLHFEYSKEDLWDTVWKEQLKTKLMYEQYCRINNYRNGTYNGGNSKSKNLVNWLDRYYKLSGSYYIWNGGSTPDTCNCLASNSGRYRCTTKSAPLTIRSGHGTGYSAIGTIPSGAEVTVTKASSTWAHVTYNGISGYASMEYLEPIESVSPSAKYKTPFKSYPLSTEQHAGNAYSDINGTNRIGYVYASDYCIIKAIYENGYCLANIPWEGSTKDIYTPITTFINSSLTPYSKKVESSSKATTYIRSSGTSELGYVSPGETVIVVDDSSGLRTQIMYVNDSDGIYRCAWVDNAALAHTHTPGAAATCTTDQKCTTCGALITNAYGHDWGPDATCTAAQTCKRCGAVRVSALGHDFSGEAHYDDAHPHAEYKLCSRCGERQNTGNTRKVSGCSQCYPQAKVTVNATGGTYVGENVRYVTKGDTVTLDTPTKEGYTFMGWASDEGSLDGMIVSNFGSPLLPDPVFANSGNQRINVYDNNESGHVRIEKIPKLTDTMVFSTGFNIKITSTGEGTEPALGGFYSSIDSKPNGVFYHVIYAKVPVGYELNDARNAIGNGGSSTWLTSKQGTGKWEWYIYRVNCGTTGEFSNFGYITLYGYADSANPVTWYVGLNQIYDATGLQLSSNKVVANNDIWLYATWKKIICEQHTYDLVSSTPATCVAMGIKNYKCRTCGHTKSEDIPKLEHKYSSTWQSDNTNHWHVCSRCNEKGSLAAHTWDTGKVTKAATETSTGIKTYTCTVCKKTKTETIPKIPYSNAVQIIAANISGRPGSQISLPIEIKKNSGVCALSLTIKYDSRVMQMVDNVDMKLFETSASNPDVSLNPYSYGWFNMSNQNFTGNGILASPKFRIKDDAPEGEYEIVIEIKQAIDVGLNAVDIRAINGKVAVSKKLVGDVDGNGKIDMIDGMAIMRYYSKWAGYVTGDKYDFTQAVADVNRDGQVNMIDGLAIMRHYNKWAGYETLPIK